MRAQPGRSRLAILAAAVMASSTAAQDVDPLFNYEATVSHNPSMWGQALALIPLTEGWEYLWSNNLANATTWAGQQPATQKAFRDREGQTVLQTTSPGQAFSMIFTGPTMGIGGILTVPAELDMTSPDNLVVYLDGEVRAPSTYKVTPNSATTSNFLSLGSLSDSSHNVTVQTGPAFSGTMRITYGAWTTNLMRENGAKPSAPITNFNAGNRLSFANGNLVQPLLTPKGEVAIEQYDFQNGEQEAALVLKGDASISVMLPRNTSFLECDGYIGPDYGIVNFALDPPPPGSVAKAYMSRSSKRPWFTHDTMFSLALNPNLHYNFTVYTEAATAGSGVYLNSSRIFPFSNTPPQPLWVKENTTTTDNGNGNSTSSNSTSGSGNGASTNNAGNVGSDSSSANGAEGKVATKTNVGAIAGGVVGGVLGGALIATAVILFLRRKRKDKKRNATGVRGEKYMDSSDSMRAFQIEEDRSNIIHPYSGTGAEPIPRKSAYNPDGLMQDTSTGTFMSSEQDYPHLSHASPYASHMPTDYFSQSRPVYSKGQPSSSGSASGSHSPGGFMTPQDSTLVAHAKGVPSTQRGPEPEIVQERDGGAMALPRPQEFVPPQYDPEWATSQPRQ